jgi:hypothetical protein
MVGGCGPSLSEGDDAPLSATGNMTSGTSNDEGSSGPPDDACAPIRPDDEDPEPVMITLRNDFQEPIFVGFGHECVLQAFEIVAPDGDVLDTIGPFCTQSCAEVIESGCSDIVCGGCGGPELIRLEPGGTWEIEWSGLLRPALEIPVECSPSNACTGSCAGRRLPESGTHTVRSIAFKSCTTDDALPCDPCGAGMAACTVFAGFESDFSSPDFTARAFFDVPAPTPVALVFGPR